MTMIAQGVEVVHEVAEMLLVSAIGGLLDFASVTFTLLDRILSVGVDLAMEREQLSFAVVTHGRKT